MFWLQRNLNKTSIKQGNQVLTYIYLFTSFTIYWLSHPHTLQLNLESPVKSCFECYNLKTPKTISNEEINASTPSNLNHLIEFPHNSDIMTCTSLLLVTINIITSGRPSMGICSPIKTANQLPAIRTLPPEGLHSYQKHGTTTRQLTTGPTALCTDRLLSHVYLFS